MPRYYFHFLDAKAANLVRDSAGVSLPNVNYAKREAISLARDLLRHPIQILNWQIVVVDASASVILRLPLSKVGRRKFGLAFDLLRRVAFYEPRFRPQVFTWLLTAVVFALMMESLLLGSALHPASEGNVTTGVYRLTGETTRLYGASQQACGPNTMK
jgi:hypothetical protein